MSSEAKPTSARALCEAYARNGGNNFCPNEMTEEQMAEWTRHQAMVPDAEAQTINDLLNEDHADDVEAATDVRPHNPWRFWMPVVVVVVFYAGLRIGAMP